MRPFLLFLILPILACNGFQEVDDSGTGGNDTAPDNGKPTDATSDNGKPTDATSDNGKPNPDLGGKRAAGDCCAKSGDCVSGNCYVLGSGPSFCTRVCDPAQDNCPVGFGCHQTLKVCVPPPIDHYHCSPKAATATQQPLGGCCGKTADCVHDKCLLVGDTTGYYFCSQPCTRQPDNCPPGYVCASNNFCVTPGDSTCTFK